MVNNRSTGNVVLRFFLNESRLAKQVTVILGD
jgi:hypothetical protein